MLLALTARYTLLEHVIQELAPWRVDDSLGTPRHEGHNIVQMSHLHHFVSTMDNSMCARLNDSDQVS